MSYTVWIKVENDDALGRDKDDESWWSIQSAPTQEDAILIAEHVAKILSKNGFDIEYLDD